MGGNVGHLLPHVSEIAAWSSFAVSGHNPGTGLAGAGPKPCISRAKHPKDAGPAAPAEGWMLRCPLVPWWMQSVCIMA